MRFQHLISRLFSKRAGTGDIGSEALLLREILRELKFANRRLVELSTGPSGTRSVLATLKALRGFSGLEWDFIYRGDPFTFWLPGYSRDFIQQQIVLLDSFYELEVLEELDLSNYRGTTIVDVGSHIGNHAVYFSRVLGAKEVVCFEPQSDLAEILERNLGLNSVPHRLERIALGAEPGLAAQSHRSEANSGSIRFEKGIGVTEMARLDDFLLAPSLLKIDVEGAEISVLEGAALTIARCRPDILIEIFPQNFSAVQVFLESAGYKMSQEFKGHNFFWEPLGRNKDVSEGVDSPM